MRVLVVDDSKAMRLIVMRTLRQAGFACEFAEANNGREAIAAMETFHADVILTDWNMPEMNGIELTAALRTSGTRVKVGFVTSEGTPEMRCQAIEAGALFLITKPFTADQFRTTLGTILS